jgi:hypothetical protein
MPVRRLFASLCLLCLPLFGALVVQSAGAAETTAVECTSAGTRIRGTERFSDEHCKTKSPTGSFFHAATPVEEKVKSELSNNTTAAGKEPGFLKATVGGLETIIEAKTISAAGTIEDGEFGPEAFAEGEAGTVKFSEVSVTNRPCTFTGVNPGGSETVGSVESQPVRGTTKGQAAGVMKFEPQSGNKLAEFKLSGAECQEALKGTYQVFGTVLSSASEGATIPIVHNTVTEQPGTKLRLKNATTGPLAGLAGKITLKKTSGGVPIAFT